MTEIIHQHPPLPYEAQKSCKLDKRFEHKPSSRNYALFGQAGGYPPESYSISREAHQLEDKETQTQGVCQDCRGIEHIWGITLLCGLHMEKTQPIYS